MKCSETRLALVTIRSFILRGHLDDNQSMFRSPRKHISLLASHTYFPDTDSLHLVAYSSTLNEEASDEAGEPVTTALLLNLSWDPLWALQEYGSHYIQQHPVDIPLFRERERERERKRKKWCIRPPFLGRAPLLLTRAHKGSAWSKKVHYVGNRIVTQT
jgi:hypothetical protein